MIHKAPASGTKSAVATQSNALDSAANVDLKESKLTAVSVQKATPSVPAAAADNQPDADKKKGQDAPQAGDKKSWFSDFCMAFAGSPNRSQSQPQKSPEEDPKEEKKGDSKGPEDAEQKTNEEKAPIVSGKRKDEELTTKDVAA